MKKQSIIVADEQAFFERGRRLAKLADKGKPIPSEAVISFGDLADLARVLTPAKLTLIGALRDKPDSITGVAVRLHRDRSAVMRDIEQLHVAGLLAIEKRPLPGHGTMKFVSLVAKKLRLEAQLA
jgi:predicted transcriptional regulator